jgi:hypothetical protein
VDHVHRQIKDVILTCSAGAQWPGLPWVLHGLRAALKEDSAVSSATVIGHPSPPS